MLEKGTSSPPVNEKHCKKSSDDKEGGHSKRMKKLVKEYNTKEFS